MLTKNANGINCDVEDTFGDPFFGGEDFDIALMEAIKKENKIFNNIDNDKYLRLKLACEKTKIELSKYDSTKIILENFLPFYDINKTITKKEFSDICKTLFTKFKKILKDFINISNINDKKDLISDIILIGGSSKIQEIKTILQEEFPFSRIRNDIEPKTCVAKGASIKASMITNPEEFCDTI